MTGKIMPILIIINSLLSLNKQGDTVGGKRYNPGHSRII